MKSVEIFVLFLLLPIVETGVFDFFSGLFDNDKLLPFDSEEFKKDLRKSLYGQHIASKKILKAVSGFMKDPNPPKPLVLSLHGPSGVGKTYVTKIIARNIYQMGQESKHVHTFSATYHFPHKKQMESAMYESQLKQWIHGNVSSFPHSMFIFDETEKMNPQLIESIKPFLDYMPHIDGVSFRKAIFIFLSNAGQNGIINFALDFWKKGKVREEIQINTEEMEMLVYEHILIEKSSGDSQSCLLYQHLVDHIIPFLPLELRHVQACVLAEMSSLNVIDLDVAHTVAKEMSYYPPEEKIFSVRGCKSIRQKLMLHIDERDII
ncbi:Torsin-1A Dystonia 1 protein [Triplophysa tibetana]|uniref:Torsin-1A Dystonia 1 protein n=1 Tax=Triplophysa tibetana TaxID=1572043 RepID=A0A5A9NBG0_9TELE|nr:Torsin-1A Dystonia 1 protein [Triplophysa tibetana]